MRRLLRGVGVVGAVVLALGSPPTAQGAPAGPTGPAGWPGQTARVAPDCVVTAPTTASVSGVTVVSATTSGPASRVQFSLDGELLGHGFTANGQPGTSFSYAAYGTASQGWSSAAVPDGIHQLTCRAVGEDGLGATSPTHQVTVGNDVTVTLVSPLDDTEVSGTVALTADFAGPGTLPTQATFTLDDQDLVTASCSPRPASVPTVRCTASWDTVTTTADTSWDAAQGLRVIGVRATAAGVPIPAAPARTFVNNRGVDMDLLLSSYERAGLGRVGRDGGFSEPLPGQPGTSLLTFGDGVFRPITGPAKLQGTVGRFGNTNAVVAIQNDQIPELHEVPDPTDDPFNAPAISPIVGSAGTELPDGTPCNASSWTTGIVPAPDSDNLLITYWSMCTYDGWFHVQAFGIAEWDPATHTAVSHDVFTNFGGDLSDRYHLQSPTSDGQYLYFWRADPSGVYQTRVPTTVPGVDDPWLDGSRYQWRSDTAPGGWSSDPADRTSVLGTGVGSWTTSIDIERFTGLPVQPYLMIIQQGTTTMTMYESASANGPWTPVPEVQDVPVCASCTDGTYAVYGHPEFSTGDTLVLTFSDRGTGRPFQRRLVMPASLR